MNEFLRPFTDFEFNQKFLESGYSDIAREYCSEELQRIYKDILQVDLKNIDKQDPVQLIKELQEEGGWAANTVREEAWHFVVNHSHVDIYIEQRQHGNSHEWATLFCKECSKYDYDVRDIADIYQLTYQAHRELHRQDEFYTFKDGFSYCMRPGIKSDPEYLIALNHLAKGEGEIIEYYIGMEAYFMKGKNVNVLFKEGLEYRKLYEKILAEGYYTPKIAKELSYRLFAENHISQYHEAFREGMRNSCDYYDVWRFADLCEEIVVNGYLWTELSNFKQKCSETWKRYFYLKLLLEDVAKDGHKYSITEEKDIRNSLDLPIL